MRILYITCWWPYPVVNGAKTRIYNLLRQIAARHEVTLLAFAEPGEAEPEHIEHLRSFCQHVEAIPEVQPNPGKLQSLKGYLSPWPRSMVYSYNSLLASRVKELVDSHQVDVILASEVDMLRYVTTPSERVPIILDDIEVARYHDRVKSAASTSQRLRAQMTLNKLEKALHTVLEQGAAVTVVSEMERHYVQRCAVPTTPIRIVPNGVDTQAYSFGDTAPQPYSLIYPGAVTYDANYEAVRFFVQEVFPIVRRSFPAATFTVTGNTGSVNVADLAAVTGVHFTGFVDSIERLIHQSCAMVVPLKSGSGTRLKILQSMALGTPVISTAKGAEGLDVHPGSDILIADTPHEIADAIARMFSELDLRQRLREAGRSLVEQVYDWGIIGGQLLDMIDLVAGKHSHGDTSTSVNH